MQFSIQEKKNCSSLTLYTSSGSTGISQPLQNSKKKKKERKKEKRKKERKKRKNYQCLLKYIYIQHEHDCITRQNTISITTYVMYHYIQRPI